MPVNGAQCRGQEKLMDLGLENRVALVIDAHLAIATAAAAALADEGAVLALTAPDGKRLRQVEMELARRHIPQERFRGVIADVEKEQDIRHLARETLHRQGDVSILVTAVADQESASTATLADEQIEPALTRNFLASVRLVREIIPHMKRVGEGRIINLLPLSALEITPQNVLSSASMAPVLAYFKGLAAELAPCTITVNNIIYECVNSPEMHETMRQRAVNRLGDDADAETVAGCAESLLLETVKSIPMQRMAEPREIGDVICMVASRKTSYLTGANIVVDGGRHHTYA